MRSNTSIKKKMLKFLGLMFALFFWKVIIVQGTNTGESQICYPLRNHSGVCNCNAYEFEFERIQTKLRYFSDLVERMNQTIAVIQDNMQQRRPRVRSGWYTPGNSYQYYVTNTTQSWQNSRIICQRLGGDLASVGLRNLTILRALSNHFPRARPVWIGLNDINQEGVFYWVDGVLSTPENTNWKVGEPNNGGNNEDCGHMNYPTHPIDSINDSICPLHQRGLCEARIE